jgi:undecaprenyl diphosphate synthase
MDGNGRWARKRSLPRHAGHRSGVKSVREIVENSARHGVEYLTLFAFSSENWRRPEEEVGMLMTLFLEALRREVADLHENNVRLSFIGERARLDSKLNDKISNAEALRQDQ